MNKGSSGDEVDIFRTQALKAKEYFRQIGLCHGFADTLEADLTVLTEGTAERAAGKENGPRTSGSGNRGFFAGVKTGAGDMNVIVLAAEPSFPGMSVNEAFLRAESAAGINCERIGHSVLGQRIVLRHDNRLLIENPPS